MNIDNKVIKSTILDAMNKNNNYIKPLNKNNNNIKPLNNNTNNNIKPLNNNININTNNNINNNINNDIIKNNNMNNDKNINNANDMNDDKNDNNNMNNDKSINDDKNINDDNKNDDNIKNTETGSVLVIILRCDSKLKDKNVENLKWVFSDPYFIIQYKYFEQSPNPNVQYNENYCMKQALIYSAEGPYINNEDGTITKYLVVSW